ncbi:MAG: hypothetical protein ABIK82_17180 [Pseudomonadota bacterium]
MDLQIHFSRLEARLGLVEDRFLNFQSNFSGRFDHRHWMFLEGLASATWQYWGNFCRSVVMESALGAKTASGVVLVACAGSRQEVSHIAAQVTRKRQPAPGGTNSDLRLEPTWGDSGKLNVVINALDLGNKDTLARSFGADSYIGHLQIVRNASAHRHHQNTAGVLALRPYYLVSRLRHPAEALLWLEEQSKTFAFLFWLEDMRMVGKLAIA